MVFKKSNTLIKNKRSKSDHLLPLVLLLTIMYFAGCTTTRRHHVLSFIFDGVPNPAEELAFHRGDTLSSSDAAHATENNDTIIAVQFVYHAPVKDKQCDACHDHNTMGNLTMPQPEVCYQCHEDFSITLKSLHGPVASGYCTACHDPHMAKEDDLLLRAGQSLCLYCHNSTLVLNNEVHKDIGGANCTECHNPHGGEDRYMLR
jgi:predicted CXXCH cytochrome family protein